MCRDCGEQIDWYTDSRGKRIPLHKNGYCSGSTSNNLNPGAARIPCPKCGITTWLVRSNGGAFWVDELGPPWAKHPCFNKIGFTGKKPFWVGTTSWQSCDFCSKVFAPDQYSDHLGRSCTNVERRKERTARLKINLRSARGTSLEHIKRDILKPRPEINGQRRHLDDLLNVPTDKCDLNAEKFRRNCNCGSEPGCVECEGSGWYIEHYDGDFSPGSTSE